MRLNLDGGETHRIDGIAGRVVQSVTCDPYEKMVIEFTDGSRLIIREGGQVGWLDPSFTEGE